VFFYLVIIKSMTQVTHIKFHEVDLPIISQFQYKHEATTYESFFDQSDLSLKLFVYLHKKCGGIELL
jgi:hypothetical protein